MRPFKLEVDTDKKKLNISMIHEFLINSYWAKNIPFHLVEKSIQNSLAFGLYLDNVQIGFGRVITDYATFGYLADIFIVDAHQGKGFGKYLVQQMLTHAELQGLRRLLLVTADAQFLYSKLNFKVIDKPENFMEINIKDIYKLQKVKI